MIELIVVIIAFCINPVAGIIVLALFLMGE